MKRLLVPTDFTEGASSALYYGLQLFKGEPVDCHLYNTYYVQYASAEVPISITDLVADEAEKSLGKLRHQLQRDYGDEVKVTTEFDVGEVCTVATRLARRTKPDLIVMGTKGTTGFAGNIIGSNASAVVRNVECPVLVVPRETPFKPPKKIVLAVDLDNQQRLSEQVLKPLLEIAKKHNSEITLLYIEENPYEGKVPDLAQFNAWMKGLKHSFKALENENVVEALEKFISKNDVDMLAMVTHKLGLFESLFHSSVTRKMTLHTRIPLLAMHD